MKIVELRIYYAKAAFKYYYTFLGWYSHFNKKMAGLN